ncbi:EI24 domain-containing protein [Amaricoccus macauensis]|uniref:EI24 domain-containing protein n=1 Tax=Amaricoccus macauensis TaxID=57001 RepID=UPI003C79C72A
MSPIADLARAVAQMGDRRFLGVLFWSLCLTVLVLAGVFWGAMLLLGAFLPETVVLPWLGEVTFIDNMASWAAVGVMLALSVVLMVPVAAIVVGFFLDGIVSAVEARHYPQLAPVSGLGIKEQLWDSLVFFGVVVGANLVALLIYLLVAPLAPFIFWIVNGFLLGREYFTLVAARRSGMEGAKELRRRHGVRIWLLGICMAIPLSVPLLNLIVPILGVAIFTHQYHRLTGTRAVP